MKSKCVLMSLVSMTLGIIMGPNNMLAAERTVKSSVDSTAQHEQQIADFIIKLAKMDISKRDQIGEILRGDWQIMPASRGRADGWITYKVKSIINPSWLESAEHDTYVERDSLDKERLFNSSVELSISLREQICFSGKLFWQPKYKHNPEDVGVSYVPQPTDGGGTLLEFSIASRDVSFRYYPADSHCVREITFSGIRTPEGAIR